MAMRPNFSIVDRIRRAVTPLWRNSRGATAIEYGLILAFIVIAMIAGLTLLADSTTGMWNEVNTKVANAR